MAVKIYDKIPIVDTARRCGLVLDSRTLRRKDKQSVIDSYIHVHRLDTDTEKSVTDKISP